MPTALPFDAAERHRFDPNASSAYNVCRDFEEHATNHGPLRDLMNARILGYSIIYSPSITARHEIVDVIHSCGNDYAYLSALGSTFLDSYILPFKSFKGRTPEGSSLPSRDSYGKTEEELLAETSEVPKNCSEAKNRTLIRDGYRCLATGKYDKRMQEEAVKFKLTLEDIQAAGGGGLHTVS